MADRIESKVEEILEKFALRRPPSRLTRSRRSWESFYAPYLETMIFLERSYEKIAVW